MDDWNQAFNSFQNAVNYDPNNHEYRQSMDSAHYQMQQANRVNWYKILGIDRHEHNKRVIKKAYKRMALKWHPDKHQQSKGHERKKAQDMFLKVGEAMEIISDPHLRQRYDHGEDHPKKNRGGW